MEKCSQIQKMIDGHLQLPDVIIQHVHSFLTEKEAAKTSVLSKSWYRSWLTRPALDFDACLFRNTGPHIADGFISYVEKTISRYEESKLTIEKFSIRMNFWDHYSASLPNKWIAKAVKLGVKYVLIHIESPIYKVSLPMEVFEAKSLVDLYVSGCKVDGVSQGKIKCFNLERITLDRVDIVDDMIEDIFKNCPLIESVDVNNCEGLGKVDVSNLLNLQKVIIRHVSCPMEHVPLAKFHDRTLGTLGSVIGREPGRRIFMKLIILELVRVKIDPAMFLAFSVLFPSVTYVKILECLGCEGKVLEISSKSLKYVICDGKFREAKFDLPSIKGFQFVGTSIPSVVFKQCSKEWTSQINLNCSNPQVSWFLKLKSFLSNLSASKVSLHLYIMGDHIDLEGDLQGSPKPVVEKLCVSYTSKHLPAGVRYETWRQLLGCFRPKFVNCSTFLKSHTDYQFWEDIIHMLAQRDGTEMAQVRPFIEGLEGVGLEMPRDTRLQEWHPLPLKTFLDGSMISVGGWSVRFHLKWKSCVNTGAHSH